MRLHVPDTEITHLTSALIEYDFGPVTEFYTGDPGRPWLDARTLGEFDDFIGELVRAKARHGDALARFVASRQEALPVREPRFVPAERPGHHFAECVVVLNGGQGECICEDIARALPAAADLPPDAAGALPAEPGHPYPPVPAEPFESLPADDQEKATARFLAATDAEAGRSDREFEEAWGKPDPGEVIPPEDDPALTSEMTAVLPAVAGEAGQR